MLRSTSLFIAILGLIAAATGVVTASPASASDIPTSVTYTNVKISGADCHTLTFDASVVADRLSGTTRQFGISDYSKQYRSPVYDISGATTSGGTNPGKNYTLSGTMPVDSNFVQGDQETLNVKQPDPSVLYVTQDTAVMSACTPTPPPPPPANNPPVANPDSATVTSGQAVTFDVVANDTDPDGNTITLTSVTQPANGTATIGKTGLVTYQSNAPYTGQDSFTYQIDDGHGGTATGTVTITVNAPPPPPPPPNQAPVAGLTVNTASGETPVVVVADGSSSTDDKSVTNYVFVWGDDSVYTSQSTPVASHTYGPGQFTLTLYVFDASGLYSSVSRDIAVTRPPGTPRVNPYESPGSAQGALRHLPGVSVGIYVFPRGYNPNLHPGVHYYATFYALETRNSRGYILKHLFETDPLPKGSTVAIYVRPYGS